jgi:drug/metabolite transporter (DMT)-like permease
LKGISVIRSGPVAALTAAALFGASTPLAKWLLHDLNPWLLGGLLYLGAGLGMMLLRLVRAESTFRIARADLPWLIGAIFSGGVVAPVLLMYGLSAAPASATSLLLNAEAVFTALLAWFVFRENVDARIATGLLLIVVGAAILQWPGAGGSANLSASLCVLGACLAWAIDNNLTRKISLGDASTIVAIKGLSAGIINIVIASLLGAEPPSWLHATAALMVGWLSYGVSLALFVVALRQLGTARTGAYFSVAPFFGALIAVAAFAEPVTPALIAAGLLMAAGVWLHVTEHHEHEHTHGGLEHEHEHEHDEHHRHDHTESIPGRHSHWHRHAPITHIHRHAPDIHHRHDH